MLCWILLEDGYHIWLPKEKRVIFITDVKFLNEVKFEKKVQLAVVSVDFSEVSINEKIFQRKQSYLMRVKTVYWIKRRW